MKTRELLLKVLSLGVGLAIGLILVAKVFFEMSYDSFYKDIDRVYQIVTDYSFSVGGESKQYGQVSGAVAPGMKREVPGVEAATRITGLYDSDRYIDSEGNILEGRLYMADSCFFDVFPVNVIAGSPGKALGKWGCVMVSRSFAQKMGGVEQCMGKVIRNDTDREFSMTIEGVFEDLPKNSSMQYDILLSLATMTKESTDNWVGNDRYKGFVKLSPGVDPSSLVPAIRRMQENNQPMELFTKRGMTLEYSLTPYDKLHTSDQYVRTMIILLGIVAALLLLVSVMNYVLIVISSVVKKSREIGIRKCYGAEGSDILKTLSAETLLSLALSLGVALVLLLALRGPVESLLGVRIIDLFVPQTIWAVAFTLLLIFAIAVFIPWLLYTRIPVSQALRSYRENSRKWKLTLLFVQFFITTFLTLMVVFTGLQYRRAIDGDIGYDPSDVITFTVGFQDQNKYGALTDALSSIPQVKGIAYSYGMPSEGSNGDNVYMPGEDTELFNIADQYEVTPGYLSLMGIALLEGRIMQSHDEIVVSESFARKISRMASWNDGAIGKDVAITGHDTQRKDTNGQCIFTIVGIYEDYLIGNLNNTDERPSALFYGEAGQDPMSHVSIKVDETSPENLERVEKVVKEILPDCSSDIHYLSGEMAKAYDGTRKIRNTIVLGSIFSLVIALFGLVGYIRNESERRSKEMAVRKINGATRADITGLFLSSVLKIAVAAVILADIAAFFAADRYLRMFSSKIELSPALFIATDIIILAIVSAAVILNSIRISRANPVDSLRSE